MSQDGDRRLTQHVLPVCVEMFHCMEGSTPMRNAYTVREAALSARLSLSVH